MANGDVFTFALAPTLREQRRQSSDNVERFRQYLVRELNRPVQFLMPTSYQETLDALKSNRTDAAMVGDYVSRHGEAIGWIDQLVAPVDRELQAQTYRSVVVVRNESAIQQLSDLRQVRLGLVDGQSTSGYLVPRTMLREAEIDPDRDLSIALFGNHRDVMEAVIAGAIDAGAAHQDRLRAPSPDRDADYAQLRTIAESRPIPAGPLVVRANLDPETRSTLTAALLKIHDAEPGAARVMLRQGHRFTMAAGRNNPTLKSIAALAGVSYATVSRVINDSGYVAPGTSARVRAIIDELGYAPNGHARVLMGRQAPMVALVVRLDATAVTESTLELIEMLRSGLEARQIPFVLCPIGPESSDQAFTALLKDKRLGAIIIGDDDLANPEVAILARNGHSIVALTSREPIPTGVVRASVSTVVADIVDVLGITSPPGETDAQPSVTFRNAARGKGIAHLV